MGTDPQAGGGIDHPLHFQPRECPGARRDTPSLAPRPYGRTYDHSGALQGDELHEQGRDVVRAALLSFMFQAPEEPSPQDQARTYADAAEAHLERAAVPGDRQLDEFDGAHKNFDLAYLTADETGHLCRALQVAELTLATVTFTDPQARLSWEEVQRDDLERLRTRAAARAVALTPYGGPLGGGAVLRLRFITNPAMDGSLRRPQAPLPILLRGR